MIPKTTNLVDTGCTAHAPESLDVMELKILVIGKCGVGATALLPGSHCRKDKHYSKIHGRHVFRQFEVFDWRSVGLDLYIRCSSVLSTHYAQRTLV